MATRLEIAHGLIAERDRVSNSADTLSVTRPATGSKTRSKGVLFIVVASTIPGPRVREATVLVADTIRHEYYYDESAGVPVCLEKSVRSADRRLRTSREGASLPPGALGVAAAVVRNNEVYLATVGSVQAYLVRSARLLMPDRSAPGGLPSDDSRGLDVWRGELSVGDALLLVSRNVTEMVGTEELKSAVLTLHPQAAAEHLHHLFVATGGEGSDGIIVIEATEATVRSASGRARPLVVGDAYGDLPGVLSEPVGGSVGVSLLNARSTLAASMGGLRDRFWEAMPHRTPRAHEVTPQASRAETQRRAAIGLMALVGVILLLGLVVVLVPRGGEVSGVKQIAGSDSALAAALDATNRADNLISTEPDAALEYYREAWDEIVRVRATGLSDPALDELDGRVAAGLDALYDAHETVVKQVASLPRGTDPSGLVEGPRDGAIFIDRATSVVSRANTRSGRVAEIVHPGDRTRGSEAAVDTPVQLAAAGPDVIVVDEKGRPWGWRPSNSAGAGTLRRITLQGSPTFGDDHGDVEAYDPSEGDYRMYVVEPSVNQVMRYVQTFDGSSFSPPTPYLASATSEVADFEQIYIDFDVYALIDNGLRRHVYERYDGTFALAEPPDGEDLRPGHDYRLVSGSGTGEGNTGRLYLYDALHGRIVGFRKSDGSYLGQWSPKGDGTEMDDVRGMYVIDGALIGRQGKREADTLVWITPEGIHSALLVAD